MKQKNRMNLLNRAFVLVFGTIVPTLLCAVLILRSLVERNYTHTISDETILIMVLVSLAWLCIASLIDISTSHTNHLIETLQEPQGGE